MSAVKSDNVFDGKNPSIDLLDAVDSGSISGTVNFDATARSMFYATLGANITVTLTDGTVDGQTLTLVLTQDATGSRTVTWPAKFKKAGGALVLTTTANAVDVVRMAWDAKTSFWREIGRSLAQA